MLTAPERNVLYRLRHGEAINAKRRCDAHRAKHAKAKRAWRKRHAEKVRQDKRRERFKLKARAIIALGGCCSACGRKSKRLLFRSVGGASLPTDRKHRAIVAGAGGYVLRCGGCGWQM